jgi:hypothetical protein
MERVYRLRDDSSLPGMQRASLEQGGLKPTHGLVGTAEWWEAIRAGALPLQTVRGALRGLWLGQWNCGPAEFLMESKDGTVFKSLCHVDHHVAARKFTLGRACEVDYVLQYHFRPLASLEEPGKLVVEIRLGESSAIPVAPIGPCYYTQ